MPIARLRDGGLFGLRSDRVTAHRSTRGRDPRGGRSTAAGEKGATPVPRDLRLWCALALLLGQAVSLGPVRVAAQGQGINQGQDSHSYTSPTFGYTVEWDDVWSVTQEFSESDFDLLKLETQASTLWLEGQYGFDGDPAVCLEDSAREQEVQPSIEEWEPLERGGEVVAGSEEGRAFAAYSYEVESEGETLFGVFYFECRTLIPGEAALEITHLTSRDAYGRELAFVEDLLASLVIPEPTAGEDPEGGEGEEPEGNEEGGATDETAGPEGEEAGGEDWGTVSSEQMIEDLEAAALDIDGFWVEVFAAAEQVYQSPELVFYDAPIDTGCGGAEPRAAGPHYCPPDLTVYMDVPWMTENVLPYGEFAPAFVLAHEWGHHIQQELDIKPCQIQECLGGATSLELELQADCLAGAWTRYADDNQSLQFGSAESAVVVLAQLVGDKEGTRIYDPALHGPGSLRAYWFLNGYYNGVEQCLSDGGI